MLKYQDTKKTKTRKIFASPKSKPESSQHQSRHQIPSQNAESRFCKCQNLAQSTHHHAKITKNREFKSAKI
ncbi:hypothetical protein BKN38_02375 [Helicobacter sp. CLO-3]|nr:hypothetical protein BA723_00655 [Helicobacter sp. CLO-3]OHU84656.1 hypothetical protein BKN38_02375 [Helicobacter sp. CLO-3]